MQIDAGLDTLDANVLRPCSACKAGDPLIIHDQGAGVVELVDASDSKSEVPCGCGGSTPPSGIRYILSLHGIPPELLSLRNQ